MIKLFNKMKILQIIIFVLIITLISYLSVTKFYNKNLNDEQKYITLIQNYFDGINNEDYEKSYNLLLKNKFTNFKEVSDYWKNTYHHIEIISIDKHDVISKNEKKQYIYKVKVNYSIKENPSKYSTIDKSNKTDIIYVIIETDDDGTLKIAKFTHIYINE
ncbi:hypothetical protein [Abyssisolibacter fermentans]|uniref:hypothetical protein n=1 Tax=Abyssisolibacter fermentans TaxID=1766203 RepID=UPI0008345322|nr:hypothetical protein [Abyssisolibacter fermentans]